MLLISKEELKMSTTRTKRKWRLLKNFNRQEHNKKGGHKSKRIKSSRKNQKWETSASQKLMQKDYQKSKQVSQKWKGINKEWKNIAWDKPLLRINVLILIYKNTMKRFKGAKKSTKLRYNKDRYIFSRKIVLSKNACCIPGLRLLITKIMWLRLHNKNKRSKIRGWKTSTIIPFQCLKNRKNKEEKCLHTCLIDRLTKVMQSSREIG